MDGGSRARCWAAQRPFFRHRIRRTRRLRRRRLDQGAREYQDPALLKKHGHCPSRPTIKLTSNSSKTAASAVRTSLANVLHSFKQPEPNRASCKARAFPRVGIFAARSDPRSARDDCATEAGNEKSRCCAIWIWPLSASS